MSVIQQGKGFVLDMSAAPELTIVGAREDASPPSETTRRRKSTGADDLSMFYSRSALEQKNRLLQDRIQELSDAVGAVDESRFMNSTAVAVLDEDVRCCL